MWSAPEEPPGAMEEGPPEPVMQVKEKCEQNKSQLESFKEIMLRNQETLKKKEEEVEEYARRLSKIKSRSKLSRRSKEATASPKDVLQTSKSEAAGSEIPEEAVEDISQAITPKAKSTLLQKKLAENRKVFEQRNKKLTESKRAVEEKVEAIRQQLEEKDVALQKDQLLATPVRSVLPATDSSSAVQVEILQEKENKIADLTNKILQLEATVLDLQENLKEKDSVIESKTKAVTLMSADLSKKGKTTLDQLEETKDEMRSMQEHFILLETSLKDKNDSLLDQLKERDDRISGLEEVIKKFELQIDEQQKSTSATVDFSRSTMDTLIETKDAMKSMQENFVLIETSLKAKNDNLLKQLETYEIKLAEANERVFQLESGMGIVKSPSVDDLQFKIDKLEESNKQLQDEKYELQKSIAEMQDQIVNRSLVPNSGALLEKDNRIAELENLVEELKQSNKLLEEESKAELQKQLEALSIKNEEYSNKITDLEKLVNDLETEKSSIAARLPDESAIGKDDDKVLKLTKELDELNKTMIKMKAQHRSKVKNLQKQLENFKMVSDKNAELVRLGNQVALLEEEKGNLQLSLVDFDELKASAGDWQERIADLESKVSTQTNEIQTHIEAIAALENQKLDLMQELHVAKQELSALEAENAESENLRVTAEMKVVDLEEQLDTLQKLQKESAGATIENSSELFKRIEDLTQENSELYNKLSKLEEKSASESGSTESFENIQELDKTELLKKLEELTQKNNELTEKVMKLEEKNNSQAGSTESFETINDGDKNVLLKKIDQLTQENSDLTMKLSRFEEKGSSDTGSTESFERIPEHGESLSKIEMLTQENQELLAKLTKLEQQLIYVKSSDDGGSKDDKSQLELLVQENSNQSQELETLKERVSNLLDENNLLQSRIEVLLADNNQLVLPVQQEHVDQLDSAETIADTHERVVRDVESNEQIDTLVREKSLLEKEMKELRNALEQLNKAPEEDQTSTLQTKIQELIDENVRYNAQISDLEESNKNLKDDLNKLAHERDELLERIEQMTLDDFARERRELIDKLEKINQEKENVARERQELQEQINDLVHKASEESTQIRREEDAERDSATAIVATLEREIEECKKLISEQADIIEDMKMKVAHKEKELEETHQKVKDYEVSGEKAESLEQELKEMLSTMEEWKYKCNEMQSKINILEEGKASIEEGFRILQSEHENLLEQTKEKETVNNLQQEEFKSTIIVLEDKLQEARSMLLAKEEEISSLKETIEIKENELHAKYVQLQNELITLDSLQDELHTYKLQIREKEAMIDTLTQEVENLNSIMRTKDEEIYSLRREVTELDEKLSRTKSLDEYNAMLEAMESKDAMFNELQNKFEEHRKESNEASIQVQKLLEEKDNVESQLKRSMQEFSDLMSVKEDLETRLAEADVEKTTAERRVWELQSILDNNARFIDDLQQELKNVYRQVEQLKMKHTEDMEMQNRRLEDLMEELNTKTQENDAMKVELEEKEHLIGQNVTEETTAALRAQVSSLEEKLVAAEDKIRAQIEKMKKIAANLKKKTALCQELEARIVELEEKLTLEKDEKEAKNKQIQEVEISMREKDNRILELEEKLTQARSEITESDINLEKITKEYSTSKEKISLLIQQIVEMEGEILKLRTDVEAQNVELAAEKEAKQSVQMMFENYKQEVMQDNKDKESELEEVKEKARELSVRMEVMEKEYVEQLALINNLKAENRLLLSRQAQISEKLENVEQESEERRAIIEELRKQVCETIDVSIQVLEEDLLEGESKETHCNNCEQCQTIIQALEAKLQERDAEIKNLDNELANSVGNFVEMREELRVNDLMNETATRNRNLEEEKEDLLHRNNILQESIKEIESKLQEAIEQNNILSGKANDLVAMNTSLEERVRERETERDFNQQDESKPENDKKVQEHEKKILSLQEELQAAQKHADELEKELSLRLSESEAEKQNSEAKIKTLIEAQQESEQRIADLEVALDRSRSQDLQSDEPIAIKEEAAVDVAASGSNIQDNVPQLFDASKIFGTSYAPDSDILSNEEVTKLQNELREKEAHCTNLTQEIHDLRQKIVEERSQLTQDCSRCTDELKATQERLNAAQVDLAKLESLVTEKNAQIDSLNTELSNVDLQIMAQCNQQEETDSKLEELVSLKDNQINELKAELSSTTEILEVLTAERDQQVRLLESNRVQIANLEAELRNSTDTELIQELEKKISETLKERDFLQLQVNDLTRSMDDLQQTIESRRNLQKEVETALREKAEAKEIAANLMRALEEARKSSDELSARDSPVPQDAEIDPTPADVPTVSPLNIEIVEAGKSSEETVEKATALDIGSGFNVEDEMWDWNPDDVQMVDPQLAPTLVPNQEAQLLTKIDELEDRIKELQTEKDKIEEENKVAQVRSAKLIKKLKEYKVQVENLQQQLKIQKSASGFYELDSAIEEELKAQISKLEKTLKEAKDEQKNNTAEKEALLKRLDVVVSANERYMEMKEKQDMELEVMRIQNKELANKVQALDQQLHGSPCDGDKLDSEAREHEEGLSEETSASTSTKQRHKRSIDDSSNLEALCNKYKNEIDELKDEMEALASENDQLQQILAELKNKASNSDKQLLNEKDQMITELTDRSTDLETMLTKTKEEYDQLRRQYEQSLMDANDQVSAMRENAELLKLESRERGNKLQEEIITLQHQLVASDSRSETLHRDLENALQENSRLEEKVSQLQASEEKLLVANSSLAEVTDLLNTRIQEVADLKQELQRQYIDREGAEAKLQDMIQSLTAELNERKHELDNLRRSLSDKESELIQRQSVETVSAIVSQATEELMQKHAIELEEKDIEIRSLGEKLATLQLAVDEYSLEMQSNVGKLAAQQEEFDLLKQALMEKESLISSLQSDLQSAREDLVRNEAELSKHSETSHETIIEKGKLLEDLNRLQSELNESKIITVNLQEQLHGLKSSLLEKDSVIEMHNVEFKQLNIQNQAYVDEIQHLTMQLQEINVLRFEIENKTEEIMQLSSELESTRIALEETRKNLEEKTASLERTSQMLNNKQLELDSFSSGIQNQSQYSSSNIVDGLPLFSMGDNETESLQATIEELKAELEKKQLEIENFKYILNENTYPSMIQELQDQINVLYNEKTGLESSLETATQTVAEKEVQLNEMKKRIEVQSKESVSKEEAASLSRERRSVKDQEEIVKLQNELHSKEQEINDLKYIIAEKDSQLSLASMDSQSDDFELRETVQRLTAELRGKEQEIEQLRKIITDLEKEVSRLSVFEKLSDEYKDAIEKLSAEKEQIRLEGEEFLERRLKENEEAINELKQRLQMENQRILQDLQLREKDLENLKRQLQETKNLEEKLNENLHEKEEELLRVNTELTEKERRLAELSITKDAELHNLKVQIHEKDVRLEELLSLSEEEEKQLAELRNSLDARETEINNLKALLEDKVKEYELIQHALKKDIPVIDVSPGTSSTSENVTGERSETTSQEFDLALYMLHQRDVRCEELTHELMQLLEERDTLQLRLSNAIRVNEELRRTGASNNSPQKEATSASESEDLLVEHPSPSRSEGPVEIAKEAIDAPIGEDKEALALKLSQLHSVSHSKDVTFKDERELRHNQQMSLLAHKDVLSTLPPEAAARLVNANYTLSRDVQSQSSVLLNWLWGKSTPKVVHM